MENFFSERVSVLSWSPLELFWRRLDRENVNINLASGSPDVKLVFQRLRLKDHLLEAISEVSEEKLFGYPGAYAPEELRREVCSLLRDLNVDLKGKEIIITTGAQHGIDLIGKVFMGPKDEMGCENPTFIEGFMALRYYSSGIYRPVSCFPSLDLDSLKKLKGIKLFYSMPTLHNPLGTDYPEEVRKEVAEISKENSFLILEDDPYRFSHESPPKTISEFSPENTIFLMSFSKMISPGFRCACMAVPEEMASTIRRAKQLDFSLSPLSYYSLYYVLKYEKREILKLGREYLERIRAALKALEEEMSEIASWTRPKGGFYVFIKVHGIRTSELLERCLRRGVAFVPGEFFYPEEKDEETIRLSISKEPPERIYEGISIIAEEARKMKREKP